ncbi:MAG: hypothetical protein JNK35_07155 [Phycisphaerae bacterium]|nr:hypothetical protein [Phycisphaerae bacterium]
MTTLVRTVLLMTLAGTALPAPTARAGAEAPAATNDLPLVGDLFRTAADPLGAEALPIRRITLYRSGVGAFERQGAVQENARVQLRFDVGQINDILKSLQLLDLDGGRIDSVSYASKDPLARRLSSFSVPIADSPSLPMLLGRLRGSAIEVKTIEGSTITGTILNVENRKVPGGGGGGGGGGKDQSAIEQPYVVLVTTAGIRAVAIDAISAMQLQDKQLADELNRALVAVAEARADRIKAVDLSLSGAGNRRVVVRYVHETPVWKTSYRLVLSDAAEQKGAAGKPVPDTLSLQGWAIVENTTDNDWKDVRLSLVSGRPVSFQMDLSEPLYLGRPDIPVPTIPGVLPRNFAAGTGGEKPGTPPMPAASAAPGRPMDPGGNVRARLAPGTPRFDEAKEKWDAAGRGPELLNLSGDDLVRYSPAAQARAGEVGEVFFFEVQNPVTIERQRSAMIPFLGSNIEGRRVSIYNMADRPDHPMRGLQLTNTSGMQLLPGPLAVFDGTAYAGDATINQVSPGDKRLLAYALDLDVVVTTKPEASGDVTKVRIVQGLIEQTFKSRESLTYTFDNKDQKRSRTIIVEHPKLHGWSLVDPEKAQEETQDLYRLEVTADAGKAASLTVTQEIIRAQQLDITSIDTPTIVRLGQSGKASPAVVKAIQQLGALQAAVSQVQNEVNAFQQQISTNTAEQTRISQTMERLPQNSDVYADYMKELKDLNTTLRTLRQKHKDKMAEAVAKTSERDAFVQSLNVE